MSKRINTQVIVTEDIVCDVCNSSTSYNAPLFSAGQVYINGATQVNYGMNITMNVYGKQVEHVCRDCMKKALEAILETV